MFRLFEPEPTFDEVATPLQKNVRANMSAAMVECLERLARCVNIGDADGAQKWAALSRECEQLARYAPFILGKDA